MLDVVARWFRRRWTIQRIPTAHVAEAYRITFSTYHGQLVLQHLMDEVYGTIIHGTDPNECIAHNARRAVIDEILRNIDAGENPQKYRTEIEVEAAIAAGAISGNGTS